MVFLKKDPLKVLEVYEFETDILVDKISLFYFIRRNNVCKGLGNLNLPHICLVYRVGCLQMRDETRNNYCREGALPTNQTPDSRCKPRRRGELYW